MNRFGRMNADATKVILYTHHLIKQNILQSEASAPGRDRGRFRQLCHWRFIRNEEEVALANYDLSSDDQSCTVNRPLGVGRDIGKGVPKKKR